MKLEYYDKWFRAKKSPVSPLAEEEAKKRHKEGDAYIALISYSGEKHQVVDIADGWVSVLFLDKHKRCYLSYDFKKKNDEKLFLSKAIHCEFSDSSDNCSVSTTFIFEENGSIYIERRNINNGETVQKESFAETVDNWDLFPEFGNYTSLLRENRNTE
ncbi:hypothetical protein [Thalassomonas actiniarum]|nr:hypothetical protein [Thalassomonas actiniarum]